MIEIIYTRWPSQKNIINESKYVYNIIIYNAINICDFCYIHTINIYIYIYTTTNIYCTKFILIAYILTVRILSGVNIYGSELSCLLA